MSDAVPLLGKSHGGPDVWVGPEGKMLLHNNLEDILQSGIQASFKSPDFPHHPPSIFLGEEGSSSAVDPASGLVVRASIQKALAWVLTGL